MRRFFAPRPATLRGSPDLVSLLHHGRPTRSSRRRRSFVSSIRLTGKRRALPRPVPAVAASIASSTIDPSSKVDQATGRGCIPAEGRFFGAPPNSQRGRRARPRAEGRPRGPRVRAPRPTAEGTGLLSKRKGGNLRLPESTFTQSRAWLNTGERLTGRTRDNSFRSRGRAAPCRSGSLRWTARSSRWTA